MLSFSVIFLFPPLVGKVFFFLFPARGVMEDEDVFALMAALVLGMMSLLQ